MDILAGEYLPNLHVERSQTQQNVRRVGGDGGMEGGEGWGECGGVLERRVERAIERVESGRARQFLPFRYGGERLDQRSEPRRYRDRNKVDERSRSRQDASCPHFETTLQLIMIRKYWL